MALQGPNLEDDGGELVGWPPPAWLDASPQATTPEPPIVIDGPPPAPPAPPPGMPAPMPYPQELAQPGAPVRDEAPAAALQPPPLSPEEEAQIQIDQPAADAVSGGTSPEQEFAARHQAFLDATGGVRTEGPPADEQARADEAQARDLSQDPYELGRANVMADAAKRSEYATQALKASLADQKQAQAELEIHQRASAKTEQDMQQVQTDAAKLATAKIDPNLHQGVLGSIVSLVALTVGGAVSGYTGGRNLALEQLNKAIDDHIQTQQMNLANQWKGLGVRQQGVQDAAQREGDRYREATTFRLATYQRAMNDLQTKMQDYDPRGTTVRELAGAYQQIAGAQQKALQAFGQQNLKNHLDVEASYQKQQEIDEKRREFDLEYGLKQQKLAGAGAGVGSATNPNYTVATDFFDPFTGDPIFGKRALDKGKAKETVQAQIGTYGHVQDYWSDLARIGAELDGAKRSMSESVYSKFKNTKAAEYDSAREALTVYLTKELGDKLAQGQLDAQKHRIPERASVFESRDPMKQIGDAQEAADRDFVRDMNLVGINAAPIVANARKQRAERPQPKATDAVSSGFDALAGARSPAEEKDAKAAIDIGKERLAAEAARKQAADVAMKTAETLQPRPLYGATSMEGMSPDTVAAIEAQNEASRAYNARLKTYQALRGDKKTAPDALGEAALKLTDAKKAADYAAQDVHERIGGAPVQFEAK